MQGLPPERRRTLQLVETTDFRVSVTRRRQSGDRVWAGTIVTKNGKHLTTSITDPAFSGKLDAGYQPSGHCLVTVGLSMPWRPPDSSDAEERCYKLIAGVIEVHGRDVPTTEELADVPFD